MKPVNIGICGLGTVGYGCFNLLINNKTEISRRLGRDLVVTHVATRSLKPEQEVALNSAQVRISTDVFAVANDPDVEVVLELIGGNDIAKDLVLTAIGNGKHVVTANKALIAVHGNEIFAQAQQHNVDMAYEAAVAGGIPIIKAIREGLASNQIQWLAGIINGTGNFILTEMAEKGRDFDEVLKEAQQLGYAEADPTFDVEGIDAAHKLTILASIAFGVPLQFERTYTEGISSITPDDISYAKELGYSIKHLGISRRTSEGLELRVHPALISSKTLLANVNGVMNAVVVHGNAVGSTLYYGAGAGANPTASAIVSDIMDVVRTGATKRESVSSSVPALGFPSENIIELPVLTISDISSAFYLRLTVTDKVGVMADITEILGQFDISIEAISQKDVRSTGTQEESVPIIILTSEIKESTLDEAILQLEGLAAVAKKVVRIRVEKLGEQS